MSDAESLTTESLNVFLATVKAELDSYNRFMELHAPQLAPGFNMINCFNPNENKLSAVIAMLLDPNGGHGQGTLFLKTFLNILTDGFSKDSPAVTRINTIKKMDDVILKRISATPALEVTTSNIQDCQRRIDILLHFNLDDSEKGFGLAIENKPWADDQVDQVTAYNRHLIKQYKRDYIQVYLSGSGEPPSKKSIRLLRKERLSSVGRFTIMTYSQLKEWCNSCALNCRSHRLRYFIEDFADYIYDNFEGGTDVMEDKIVAELASKAENIATTIAISNAWPTVAHMLIKELAEKAKESAGLSPDWKLNVDFELSEGKGFEIFKEDWNNKFSIKFAFGTGYARDFLFGICTQGDKKSYPENVYEQLNAAFGKGDQPNDWWAWSKYFDDPYRNWINNDKLWSDIKNDGEIIKQVADKLAKFASINIDQFEP